MFNKSFISILCLLMFFDPFMKLDIVFAGNNKGFFPGGGGKDNDGDKALQNFESSFGGGGDSSERTSSKFGRGGKGNKGGKGGSKGPKNSHSAGMKLFDDLAAEVFPLGDKNGGLPDTPAAIAKYCVEFEPKGLGLIAYTQSRWPNKYLYKAIVTMGSMGLLKLNTVYCANPVSINHFTQMAKSVNSVNDELAKIKDEFAVRALNSYSKMDSGDEKQKHTCCAFIQYKKKTVEAVPDDAKEFVKTMLEAHFIAPQRIFCQEFQDETYEAECGKIEFNDDDPDYPIPRGLYTAPSYVITQFV